MHVLLNHKANVTRLISLSVASFIRNNILETTKKNNIIIQFVLTPCAVLTDVPKNTIFKKSMHQGGYMAVHYEIKMHIDDNQVA